MKQRLTKIHSAVLAIAMTLTLALPVSAYTAERTLATNDGITYITSAEGTEPYTGWSRKNGRFYLYINGIMKKNCWVTSGGIRKYFLGSDGARVTGRHTIGGVEYDFDKNGMIVPDKWGITLTAADVTPTGLILTCTQSGSYDLRELSSGSYYTVERYENGKWSEVEPLPQEYDVAWTAESWLIEKNSSVTWVKTDWKWYYGELEPGNYRIGKKIMNWRRQGDSDIRICWAYFEIE